MKLQTTSYQEQLNKWPKEGHHIMAQYDDEKIIVYQAYSPTIGLFAAENQYFGGKFKLDRMTWIKPNFLWMMYRNGWGTKVGQEITLAIHLKKEAFIRYLNAAEYSSFGMVQGLTYEEWQTRVAETASRLQWDPDHDPYGNKMTRRAIQIGLRNELTQSYAKEDILLIENISDFVQEQYQFVQHNQLENLVTPIEKPLYFNDEKLNMKLKLNQHE